MARRGSAPLMRARLAFAKETAFVTIFEERSVEHMPTSGHYRDTKRRGRPGDSGSEGCEAARNLDHETMRHRNVPYRSYPNMAPAERFLEMRGPHQRLYNTALEEGMRIYQETGEGPSFAAQRQDLPQWRTGARALRG